MGNLHSPDKDSKVSAFWNLDNMTNTVAFLPSCSHKMFPKMREPNKQLGVLLDFQLKTRPITNQSIQRKSLHAPRAHIFAAQASLPVASSPPPPPPRPPSAPRPRGSVQRHSLGLLVGIWITFWGETPNLPGFPIQMVWHPRIQHHKLL